MPKKKAKGQKTFQRVLVANRGEIALRVMRTLREMGIAPIAVYSDADRTASHVRAADLAYRLGPGAANESYLCQDRVLLAAKELKADAIHPGYGFLSENADFAKAVEAAGITFIGPSPEAMKIMGSKTAAREAMMAAGVPVVPGSDGPVATESEALAVADKIGFPLMLKARAGGGGKGMRLIQSADEVASALRAAASEAENAFGDPTVYLEKAVISPRHIEIQIMSGPDGKAVWLGERECSMQRRHQKVIEETPSTFVDTSMREHMGQVACMAADAVGYVGAGTVEFLVDQEKNFYFLEMNTRLQVEHPITEMCCGVDLVELQVQVAQGMALGISQDDISRKGHAIEARIYAEDPQQNFLPCPGMIEDLVLPHWPGVRVDCGVERGGEVTRYYDPMIAKVVAWGDDREAARRRLVGALSETAIKGITTNTQFLRRLLETEAFKDGDYHTGSIAEILDEVAAEPAPALVDIAMAAAVVQAYCRDQGQQSRRDSGSEAPSTNRWRTRSWREGEF